MIVMNLFLPLIWFFLLLQLNDIECSTTTPPTESESSTFNIDATSSTSVSPTPEFESSTNFVDSTTSTSASFSTQLLTTVTSSPTPPQVVVQAKGAGLKAENASDEYMKQLDIYHIDDKCQMARFGYYQNFYEISKHSGGNGSDTIADLLEPQATCPRKEHAIMVSSEGRQYYDIRLTHDPKSPFSIYSSKILYAGIRKEKFNAWLKPQVTKNGEWDLSNCFEDLGSLYCLRSYPLKKDKYFFYRLTKIHSENVNVEILDFKIAHRNKPFNILQDSQSGHIAIVYKDFGGHEGNVFDIRSIYEFGRRGKLVRPTFSVQHTLGVASHNKYRFFIVYPKNSSELDSETNSTFNYTFYRTPTSFPTVYNETGGANWEALGKRNARRIKMFFKNDISDYFPLSILTVRYCTAIADETDAILAKIATLKDVQTAMIVFSAVLFAIFVLFLVLLLIYILCFAKPRRFRKRKKTQKASTSKLSKNNETDALLGKKKEKEKKKKENKVVKKLKELGGVDYSSSEEEKDLEKTPLLNAANGASGGASPSPSVGSQPGGETNQNCKNPSENSVEVHEMQKKTPLLNANGGGASPSLSVGNQTGAYEKPPGNSVEEQEMQDKFSQYVIKGPRSDYMSPEKKSKRIMN